MVVGQTRWTTGTNPFSNLWNGRVVDVLSDPFPVEWCKEGIANAVFSNGEIKNLRTGLLIPIRDPDADSKSPQHQKNKKEKA